MISRFKPLDFNVLSLTTIATPHHGSAFADYMFDTIGRRSDAIHFMNLTECSISQPYQGAVQSSRISRLRDWCILTIDAAVYEREFQPEDAQCGWC